MTIISETKWKRQPKKKSSKRLLSSDGQQMTPTGDKSSAGGSGSGTQSAVKRQKRGKQFRDQNAPRMPLNGYVRFLNANRERVKAANPTKSFADITKLLAAEWSALGHDQKRHYLDEAEKAKEQYLKEFQEYQRTEAYQEFQQKQKQRKDMKLKASKESAAAADAGGHTPTSGSKAMTGSSAHNINGIEYQLKNWLKPKPKPPVPLKLQLISCIPVLKHELRIQLIYGKNRKSIKEYKNKS